MSYGKENVQISCVNGIDRSYPEYVEYSGERLPGKGVFLNTDPEFLVGCDCTDGCRVGLVLVVLAFVLRLFNVNTGNSALCGVCV